MASVAVGAIPRSWKISAMSVAVEPASGSTSPPATTRSEPVAGW